MRVGLAFPAVLLGPLWWGCGPSYPSSLEFLALDPPQPRIGEITTLSFKAMDGRGVPMAGAEVSFKLESNKPGVTLSPALALTNKGDGVVYTQVTARGHASSIVVLAEAGDKLARSPPITFAGASPNGKQFTFQCGELAGDSSGGVHAISAYDESRHMIAGVKLLCIAHVGDRNGDGLEGVLVSFLTEAGTIGPTETSLSDVVGNAKVLYKTSLPLPKDVKPEAFTWNTPRNDLRNTGEYKAPLWMHPFLWVNNPITMLGSPPNNQEPRRADPIRPGITMNPRDNLVTMIAFTNGEEGYDDVDNDGQYDNGEPWDDLTEPFVDDNDNGTWDLDERWVDTNDDGLWNGKNGQYDSSTLIWVQERILWTGIPHPKDTQGAEPVFRLVAPAAPPAIPHFGYDQVTFLLGDPWFNTMAQNGESDGFHTVPPEDKPLVVPFPSKAISGVRFTYPATSLIDFKIKDAHDPFAKPPDPPYAAPMQFWVPIVFTTTASPYDGHTINLLVATITGTVL
ncbi:MAG: hypothetical protein HYZ28_01470 [Myxococcales bacterium]|nr:hypothetical protein [Myxococcales bacterium]